MTDTLPEDRVLNVLFLCTGNSARSIIAEMILNRQVQGRFKAFSAGCMPAGEVNPYAISMDRYFWSATTAIF